MKIVNLLGGLGNQMFEYAMYLALKEAHPQEEIKVCTRSFSGYELHNGLEIQRVFEVELPEASLLELTKLAYPFFSYKTWQMMRHWLPVRKKTMTMGTINIPFDYAQVKRLGSTYYDGYWQNEKNFKPIREIILKAYAFSSFEDENNKTLEKDLQHEISVSCHVRRGDYLKLPEMCVCTPSYYERAISEMNAKVNPTMYVVFSDDIAWCRENIVDLIGKDKKVVFVDWNKGVDSYRDMQLMTLCNHNIIANSSFSWWGGWLNTHNDSVVIAPQKWMNIDTVVNDPIPDSWIRIGI